MKVIETELPRIKWKLLDKEKAEKLGVDVISFDEKNRLLLLNVCKCPKELCLIEWLERIIDMGIVFYEENN